MSDLHLDIFWGQGEVLQAIVSGRVRVRVQTGGEVTAGHGHPHHSVADTFTTGHALLTVTDYIVVLLYVFLSVE